MADINLQLTAFLYNGTSGAGPAILEDVSLGDEDPDRVLIFMPLSINVTPNTIDVFEVDGDDTGVVRLLTPTVDTNQWAWFVLRKPTGTTADITIGASDTDALQQFNGWLLVWSVTGLNLPEGEEDAALPRLLLADETSVSDTAAFAEGDVLLAVAYAFSTLADDTSFTGIVNEIDSDDLEVIPTALWASALAGQSDPIAVADDYAYGAVVGNPFPGFDLVQFIGLKLSPAPDPAAATFQAQWFG